MKYQTYLLLAPPAAVRARRAARSAAFLASFIAPVEMCFARSTRAPRSARPSSITHKGQLVPDEITVELWKAQIDAAVNSHTFKPDIDLLVLDGIPRNVGQAKIMEDLIDVRKVFHLSCPNRDALFARLKNGR